LRRFGVIYRGLGLSLVLHRSFVLIWCNTGIYTGLSVLTQV